MHWDGIDFMETLNQLLLSRAGVSPLSVIFPLGLDAENSEVLGCLCFMTSYIRKDYKIIIIGTY